MPLKNVFFSPNLKTCQRAYEERYRGSYGVTLQIAAKTPTGCLYAKVSWWTRQSFTLAGYSLSLPRSGSCKFNHVYGTNRKLSNAPRFFSRTFLKKSRASVFFYKTSFVCLLSLTLPFNRCLLSLRNSDVKSYNKRHGLFAATRSGSTDGSWKKVTLHYLFHITYSFGCDSLVLYYPLSPAIYSLFERHKVLWSRCTYKRNECIYNGKIGLTLYLTAGKRLILACSTRRSERWNI